MPTKIRSIKIDWAAVRKELAPCIKHAPEFAKRYRQISKHYKKVKASALAQVKTWECYTFSNWDLDPSSFLLNGYLRPGRRMKTDPGPEAKVLRYGFDASGRIVTERWPSISQESFWEYHPDRIDGLAINTSSRPASKYFRKNVESLFLEKGKPAWYFREGEESMKCRRYWLENDRFVKVFSAYLAKSGMGHTGKWFYEVTYITYDAKGDAQVRSYHQEGYGYAHTYKMPKRTEAKAKVPVLDVRKDIADVVATIGNAVKKFAGRQGKSTVSGIGLGFHPFEEPQIFVRFDTRPDYEPDGEWTHPEFANLKRPRWAQFIDDCEDCDGKGAVIDAEGKRHEITEIASDERIVGWLGDALVVAMKKARAAGLFKPLKRAKRCELSIEDAGDGAFGWPRYEDRGKENLVK